MTPAPEPRKRSPRIKEGITLPADDLRKVEEYISASVPDKHKTATGRALRAQVPKSVAIKVKCLQCCGYQLAEIALCRVVTCALHPVRPYQGKNSLPTDAE